MEQQQSLIDTNVVIDYLGLKLPESGMQYMNEIIDDIPNISIITKIEVLGFNAPSEHYSLLLDFMEDAMLFDLNEPVINKSIEIRKNYKTKLPDAIIAATALVYGFSLITRDVGDFKGIEGLYLVDPHNL